MIGRDAVKKRYDAYHKRMSENDLNNGFGVQYTFDEER